jgi:hypothetical protein
MQKEITITEFYNLDAGIREYCINRAKWLVENGYSTKTMIELATQIYLERLKHENKEH